MRGGGASYDSFYKGGAGTLILTGANTFGGSNGTMIDGGGTLDLGNGNTGSFTGTFGNYLIVNSWANLGIGLANSSAVAATINNAGAVSGIELSGVTNTLNGILMGAGSLTQTGAGTTVLNEAGNNGSTYFTGAVTINAGAIELTNTTAIGASAAGHMTSGVTVNSGGALQIGNSITTGGAYATTLNGAGVTAAAHGALESVSGTNTYTGAITLGSASAIGADAGSLTASGAIANGGNLLTAVGAGNTTLTGVISGSGGFTAAASGTVTIGGAGNNTYTGVTTVSSGELDLDKVGSSNLIAVQGANAKNVTTAPDILVNGGTLKFLANDQLANSIDTTGNVTLSLTSGTVNLNGTSQTLYAFQNSGGTFSTGANGYLYGTGATVAFAGGTNTINSGATIEDNHFVISGGTNTVQSGGSLQLDGFGTGIVFSNGANITLNSDTSNPGAINFLANNPGATYTISSTAASTTATITSGGSASQAGTLNLNGNTGNFNIAAGSVASGGADLAVSAVISDGSGSGSSVYKTGAGTLQLSAANTYTGGTTVGQGNLLLTGSLASGSPVAVGDGTGVAALSGTGTVNSSVTLSTSGSNVAHLAPGVNTSGYVGTAGTLVVKGALGLGTNSDLDIDLSSLATTVGSGVNDLVSMSGGSATLSFGSALTINYNILGGTSPLTTGTYTLINGFTGSPTLPTSITSNGLGTLTAHYLVTAGAFDVYFTAPTPAVAYWSGATSGSWATTTNFNSSVSGGTAISSAPGAVTDVVFSTSTPTVAHLSTTLDAATSINSLHFNASSGNVTIASGTGGSASTLTLAAATTTGNSTPGVNTAPTGIALDNGSGNVTISAPIVLGGNQSWSNAGTNLLSVSGGVTGAKNLTLANNSTGGITISGGSLNNGGLVTNSGSGSGTTTINSVIGSNVTGVTQSSSTSTLILGATNSYGGGTTLSAGKTYVTGAISGSNSGTGTGAVNVTGSGTLLAGTGGIKGAVSLSSGTNLYSGGVVAGNTPSTGPGTGLTLGSSLSVNSATLTFALNTGSNNNGSGYHSWANPNENSSYLVVSGNAVGEISFTGSDTIGLVDLTTGGLTALRAATPYLLIQAGLDSDYSGLVTSLDGKTDDLVMDGDGWVMGVGTVSSYTPINFTQYGADGTTALSGTKIYPVPELYLDAGNLEVVPEPGTWALMLGGLALLVVIQRRRNNS